MIKDFLSGVNCFLRGFKLAIRPGLRRFILIPLFINTLVFTAAIWLGIDQFDRLLDWMLPGGNSWWGEFARVALWIFFAALTLIVPFFTFTLVANLIGAPFNGLLSEKAEEYLAGRPQTDPGGLRNIIASIIPSILSELKKLVYFLAICIPVFVLSLIPVVNIISPFIWAAFTSWMLALEYIAYPFENHNIFFSQVRATLKKKKALSLGFGTAVMVATLIPLINFFVMPSAVAGATIVWSERLKHNRHE